MYITLEVNKEQLAVFRKLAGLMNIKVRTRLDEAQEEQALYNAMQEGDQSVMNEKEKQDFLNSLAE